MELGCRVLGRNCLRRIRALINVVRGLSLCSFLIIPDYKVDIYPEEQPSPGHSYSGALILGI